MIGNSGSVTDPLFFVSTPSPTPSLRQSRDRLWRRTPDVREPLLQGTSSSARQSASSYYRVAPPYVCPEAVRLSRDLPRSTPRRSSRYAPCNGHRHAQCRVPSLSFHPYVPRSDSRCKRSPAPYANGRYPQP